MMNVYQGDDDWEGEGQEVTSQAEEGRLLPASSNSRKSNASLSFCDFIQSLGTEFLLSMYGTVFGRCCDRSIALQSGRRVRIAKRIAEGAYSFVHVAQDVRTGESFAIKCIRCQSSEQVLVPGSMYRYDKSDSLDLVKWEIQVQRELSHPTLLKIVDAGSTLAGNGAEEIFYLLMPLYQRGTLRDKIDSNLRQRKTMTEETLIRIFRSLCEGVQQLHQHIPPWVHRDIKPENVLLSPYDDPVLIDFGSVTASNVKIQSRHHAIQVQEDAAQHCSMPYRAPELFDVPTGATLDARTDVWSLGCLLFAMCFGYSPFECTFTEAGELRVQECTFLRVIGTWDFPVTSPYSPSLHKLIRRMLSTAPEDRPFIGEVVNCLSVSTSR